jgi:exodeoxyribonuclease VIII
MLDKETLGVVPGCIGLSIGAVEFFPEKNKLGREFHCVINVTSSLEHYLREEKETREWWNKQSAEARVTLAQAEDPAESMPLPDALTSFNNWQRYMALSKNIRLYGNGADFDNPILRVMYDAANIQPYAATYGGRCYRTLKNLDELFGPEFRARKLERVGVYHNALDDAKSQALHLMAIIADIKRFVNYGGGESTL